MKRRSVARLTPSRTDTVAARTGEHCPESGWWYPSEIEEAKAAVPRFIGEGSVMPAAGGTPSLWLQGRPQKAGKQEELAR